MKFIDQIIKNESQKIIYWLWNPNINLCIAYMNLDYGDNVINKYNKNLLKKNTNVFIFVKPVLDIYFYRLLIDLKDNLINDGSMPHIFVITDRKPDIKMCTVHIIKTYYLSFK